MLKKFGTAAVYYIQVAVYYACLTLTCIGEDEDFDEQVSHPCCLQNEYFIKQ